jgi:hypothetical protein
METPRTSNGSLLLLGYEWPSIFEMLIEGFSAELFFQGELLKELGYSSDCRCLAA